MKDYTQEKGFYENGETFLLNRENIEKYCVDEIVSYPGYSYYPGLSSADPENLNRPRERELYLKKFLNPAIKRGEIGDGIKTKFDDRKFRFDKANVVWSRDRGNELELKLGITHYAECANCRKWDDEKREEMIKKGKEIFNDMYAFFTKGCGIEATPITSDGHIFVGKRKVAEEASGYAGELAAVNGWVDYKGMNPHPFYQHTINVDFRKDTLREMREEYGIQDKDIDKLIFSGVVSALNMADTDFVYLVPLRIGDEEFLDRFKKRQDEEHSKLIKITNYQNMQELLQTGRLPGIEGKFNLLYSLRASLEQIKPEEMA